MPTYCLRFFSMLLCLFFTACSTTPQLAGYPLHEKTAVGQSSRVRHIVLHYTSLDTTASLETLTQAQVSSHYLISDEQPPKLYRLVPESERAWHAGLSQWYQHTDLNTSSIGIEIVNAGRQTDGSWAAYQPAQITLLQALLHDVATRHRVKPSHIVGHSDIAPQRKIDPGPLFPWQQLAANGLGRWYDSAQAQRYQAEMERYDLPSNAAIQQLLHKAGYAVPLDGKWDKSSQNVMAAFQMHYRPARYDGTPDAESIAILKALQNPLPHLWH